MAELAQTPSVLLRDLKIKSLETILANAREYMRINASQLASEMKPKWKLPTGVVLLDKIIGGGIESQVITEFYGPFSSGKTQCCQTLAVQAIALDGDVFYLDSENQLRAERLKQIAEARGLNSDEVLKRIHVSASINSDHQRNIIHYELPEICRNFPIKLLVMDSVMAHFAAEYIGRAFLAERQQILNQHIYEIQRIARVYDFPVAITNQIRSKPNTFLPPPYNWEPIGGQIIAHSSSLRLCLRQGKGSKEGYRIATLMDSSSCPYGEAPFRISERGIEDAEVTSEEKE